MSKKFYEGSIYLRVNTQMSHNRKLRKTGFDKVRKYVDKYVPTGKWTVLSFSDMIYMKQQYCVFICGKVEC